ncbi:glycosyltransferase family 39 protein [Thermocrinis sp.]|uniref:ArnT family glycosyltransferase n=1 Tax=Thermocrinis sp. TaxID=2024383 RepID=UPI002FDE7024
MVLILIFLTLLSLLPNLSSYVFRNEEALRVYVAYQMVKTGNYFQLYVLGEPYYNKPPLFNWLIALYSNFIPWSELTARAVSLTSLVLCAIVIFLFSRRTFGDYSMSVLSSLVFLTFGNVLFFYGYLAEIDTTYTLFVFITISSLYIWSFGAGFVWGILGAFFAGLSTLLKGFPSYAFYFLTLLALSLYHRRLGTLLSKKVLFMHLITLVVPLLWLINTEHPITYLKTLFYESFSRVSHQEFSRIVHFFTYPLENFKDLMPHSVLFLISVYILFKEKRLHVPSPIKALLLIFLFNYLPYLYAKSAGRYIMPLYPVLAIIFSLYINRALSIGWFKKAFYTILIMTIGLRFAYGLVYMSYKTNSEHSKKVVAQKILKSIDLSSNIECNCRQELAVCLYVSFAKGEPLKRKLPEADYSITCTEEEKGEEIASFDVKRAYKIRVLKLN